MLPCLRGVLRAVMFREVLWGLRSVLCIPPAYGRLSMLLTRSLMPLLVLAVFAQVSLVRAEDDDPPLRGKKLSEWINLMQNGKNVDERRVGLLAVKLIGPRKSRKVVPALIGAVRENSEAKIRAGAALALGDMAAKARGEDDIPIDKIRDALSATLRTDKADSVREACARRAGRHERQGTRCGRRSGRGPERSACRNWPHGRRQRPAQARQGCL